jgi:hypothetical protein
MHPADNHHKPEGEACAAIPEFLPPTDDWVFKHLFGDKRNESILIDLIKAFVELPEEEYMRDTKIGLRSIFARYTAFRDFSGHTPKTRSAKREAGHIRCQSANQVRQDLQY